MRKVQDMNVHGKRVFCRVDFNVPLKNGEIVNDRRIREALPTINYLLKQNAIVILATHLGRPDGKPVQELSTKPLAKRVSLLTKKPVEYIDDCIGQEVEDKIGNLSPGEIVMLENLRFYPQEEENDENFAKALSSYADCYVNDAFGASHRKHASIYGITKYLPSSAGLLLQKETEALQSAGKQKPYVVILGGSKLSGKLQLIKTLHKKADAILVGGAMAFTFINAAGMETGKSLVENDFVKEARKLMKTKKIILPEDFVTDKGKQAAYDEIPKNAACYDIGPETIKEFEIVLAQAKDVFWNGPMGKFEDEKFSKGTDDLAKLLSKSKARVFIGGGDTITAIDRLKLYNRYHYVSTGGGAGLEFIEGKKLPGLEALGYRR